MKFNILFLYAVCLFSYTHITHTMEIESLKKDKALKYFKKYDNVKNLNIERMIKTIRKSFLHPLTNKQVAKKVVKIFSNVLNNKTVEISKLEI